MIRNGSINTPDSGSASQRMATVDLDTQPGSKRMETLSLSANFHPEAKSADAFGNPCDRQTTGLLQRRHIKIDQIKCIGKESNSLENVDEGMVHSEQNVYTEYADPKRSDWITKIQPALKKSKVSRARQSVRKTIVASGDH